MRIRPGDIPEEAFAPFKNEVGIYQYIKYQYLFSRFFIVVKNLPKSVETGKVYLYRFLINDTYISDAGLS